MVGAQRQACLVAGVQGVVAACVVGTQGALGDQGAQGAQGGLAVEVGGSCWGHVVVHGPGKHRYRENHEHHDLCHGSCHSEGAHHLCAPVPQTDSGPALCSV